MDVFAQLFKSPVGILSAITIGTIIIIAIIMFLWVKKQADLSEKKQSGKSELSDQ